MIDKPDRISHRLKSYNYLTTGAYFITICTKHRECTFGNIVDGAMKLNNCGEIVSNVWNEIPEHFKYVSLDEYMSMPSHLHGIIIIHNIDLVGTRHAVSV